MSRNTASNLPNFDVLIPAAGASSRLGHPKQLVTLGGEPLLRRAVRIALTLGPDRVHVVLGAHRERIRPVLDGITGVQVHEHENWATGMSGSLIAGMEQLAGDCPAVLILLPDQFRITALDLARLRDAWRRQPGRPVAAAYDETFGVPAILPRALFDEVKRIRGDCGARSVLSAHHRRLIRVTMSNAAFDLDSPEDWAFDLDPDPSLQR